MSDEPKETSAKVLTPCPGCGGKIPDTTVWVYMQKFYCSEACVRRTVGRL